MMHRPWSSIVEVPYCFSRSNVKFQGHTALKIVKSYRNWAFLDSNSSLNSLMVMKCCTKLETAKERCPIVFQSHPSNFKVTRDKTSPLLTRIGRFRTIGRSQLSNPSDLPCFVVVWLWWILPITYRVTLLAWMSKLGKHYNDVIISAMVFQITSLTIVSSTVYSGADQRNHQSSASLAFVPGIHRSPVNSMHKGPITRKMFPFDDVIMNWEKYCHNW